LLSDFWPHGAVAQQYGVLRPEGYAERAIFILDADGVIQYIDIHAIDDQPDNEELFKVLRQLNPEAARQEQVLKEQPEEPQPGRIILYCTTWCPACRKARLWLEDRDLEFTVIDVDRDPAAAAKVRGWANGNLTTPTFDIDGTIVVDYVPDLLAEAVRKRSKG